MKEHPILMTGESVKGILADRKTQTRRVPVERYRNWQVGDVLWVRETWLLYSHMGQYIGKAPKVKPADLSVGYKADEIGAKEGLLDAWPWRPSIFMPKWATRIWLEITNLRVERVQDINASDILEEGVLTRNYPDLAQSKAQLQWLWDRFCILWDSINAKRGYGYDKNPQVKVIEFKRILGERKCLSGNTILRTKN